jgi:hypothetical protein
LLIDLARLETELGGEGFPRARAALDEALRLELGGEDGQRHFAGSNGSGALDELERLALRADRSDWRSEAILARLALLDVDAVLRPAATAADAARLTRAALYRLRLASLAEEQGDAASAIAHLEAALSLAHDDAGTAPLIREELRLAARAAQRPELEARLSLEEAGEAPAALRGALYLEAVDAFFRADRLADAEAASGVAVAAGLTEAVELRARRRAELESDDEALLRSYVAEADRRQASGDGVGVMSALAGAATIAGDQLGRADDALALGERALSSATPGPLFDEHADAMEWRLARLARYEEWAALLARRAAASAPGAERDRHLALRATLLAEQVGDRASAIGIFEERLRDRPDDARLRHDFVALARIAGEAERAAQQLRELAAQATTPGRKAALELERGALLAWHAGDRAAAEQAFRAALQAQPGDARATAALEALFEDRGVGSADPEKQDDASPERADTLIAALRAELETPLGSERASLILSRLAELYEGPRRDPVQAAAAYAELVDRATDSDEQAVALRGVARAQAALGNREALITALERELDLLTDTRARVLQRARIAWAKERRDAPDAAEDDHRALVSEDAALGSELRATARLGRLRAAYRANDAAEITEALGQLVAVVDPELTSARAALDVEHAWSLLGEGATDEAAVVAGRAHAALPESRSAQLAALVTSGARHDMKGVADSLEAIGSSLAAPQARASVLRRAAWLGLAAGEEPEVLARRANAAALDDAALFARGELAPTGELLGQRAALAEGVGRIPWLLELGETHAAHGELAAASASFAQVLAIEPRSMIALELDRRVRLAAGDALGHARRTLTLGELLTEGERAAALLVEAGVAFEALAEVRSAAYAYREALARSPFDASIFARARSLLVAENAADGERREFARGALLDLYTAWLAHVQEAEARASALVERAALCAEAGDRAQAEADLRAALELDPDDVRATWDLAKLTAADSSRIAETRQLVAALRSAGLEPPRRRALELMAADVESGGGGDPERAIVALEAALGIEDDVATLRRLAVGLLKQSSWQRAIDARRRLVPRVEPKEAAALELEIVRIYFEGFSDAAAAREAALRALKLSPMSSEALAALGETALPASMREEAAETLEASLEAARVLLGNEATRGIAASHIAGVARARGDELLRALAEQLLALHVGDPPPARALGAIPAAPIPAATRRMLRGPLAESVLYELVASIPEACAKMYPFPAARAGKLNKLSSKQRDLDIPVLVVASASLELTIPDVELGQGSRVDSDDHRLVVGREALPLFDKAQGRFRLTRALALFADRSGVLDRIDENEFVALVAGALALVKVTWPTELSSIYPSTALVDDCTRKLDDALPRRERKALLSLAPRLAALPDPRRYRAAALSAAARLALFATADLAAAANELGEHGAVDLGRTAVSAPMIEAWRTWRGAGR